MNNNFSKKRGKGKPSGGVSLIEVPMQDLMNVCNAAAVVTIGRVWGEKMGIIKPILEAQEDFNQLELFD